MDRSDAARIEDWFDGLPETWRPVAEEMLSVRVRDVRAMVAEGCLGLVGAAATAVEVAERLHWKPLGA
jgi:hypothetical protein